MSNTSKPISLSLPVFRAEQCTIKQNATCVKFKMWVTGIDMCDRMSSKLISFGIVCKMCEITDECTYICKTCRCQNHSLCPAPNNHDFQELYVVLFAFVDVSFYILCRTLMTITGAMAAPAVVARVAAAAARQRQLGWAHHW